LKREHYRLPTFEDVLPQFENAKVFTKLDIKEAYWHIRLDKKSSLLTTMITPYGRFRWTRLPFGLSVSGEIFQKKLVQVLEGLDGIINVADDIVVPGCGMSMDEALRDHETKMAKLKQRCNEKNSVEFLENETENYFCK
jgi:Reverse transcriptase (RNA-dependent DNA polymerase)